jgi:predicted transcriptional regulator
MRELDRRGHTQSEIAVEIGCSQSTVQKWLQADEPRERRRRGVLQSSS